MNWGMDQGQGHAQPLMMLDDGGMMLDAGWTLTLCCYKPRPMMAYDGLWAHARVIIGHLAIWQHCSEPATLCSKDMATRVLLYAIVSLPRALLLIVRGGSPPDPLQALQRVYCIYVSYTYIGIYKYTVYIYILASLWQKQSPLLGQHANVYIYPSVTVHPSHMSSWTVKAMRTYMPH